ncbi:MAG: hypothetical protein Q8P68_04440 [Candidatus Peregrinibacteria bacterium]|nr:hypothetical protein [Candidatus Peregrinibacteria bacterium]MDZ4245240.1 hypothetical protein [Candidatus Gracilibacteria bacterium]
MKYPIRKLFVLTLILGLAGTFGKAPALWLVNTLNADQSQQKISWYDEKYVGEELAIESDNPNYDGIILNINNILATQHIDDFTMKKYIKDMLTLRRGPNARVYLKRICRTIFKKDLTSADVSSITQTVLSLIKEEPTKDSKRIQAFVDDIIFPDSRYKTRLERSRSICHFIEEAHDFEKDNHSTQTLEVSVGLVRYLLQNNITYPIAGLLRNSELSEDMKALLFEYKNIPDLAPLINSIENVALASFEFIDSEAKVISVDPKNEKKSEAKMTIRKSWPEQRTATDSNLPFVPDFSTPVRR